MQLVISPGKIAKLLSLIVGCLVLLSLLGQINLHVLHDDTHPKILRRINVEDEANIPTWYQSSVLLVGALLAGVISRSTTRSRTDYRRHWLGLSVLFLLMSLDEAATLHELVIEPLRSLLNAEGLLYFTWVVPAAISVLILASLYLRFFLHLPPRIQTLFFLAGCTYIAGALGMELIGGYTAERWGMNTLPYAVAATVEETLEMIGIIVFIYALLVYMENHQPPVSFVVQEDRRPIETLA